MPKTLFFSQFYFSNFLCTRPDRDAVIFFIITVSIHNCFYIVQYKTSKYTHLTVRISDFFLPDFSLATWMSDQGLSFDGSLSTALAAVLFKKLGIDAFLKSPACERTEAPYSVNRIQQTGWSSGNKVFFTLFVL